MDATFRLRFLGPVQVERDGQPVLDFRSRKALALLGYLAVQDRPLPREHLVDLFWEDRAETPGRANLSWVLSRITTRLPGCLQTDRHTVQFQRSASCWLDVDAFDELEAQGDVPSLTEAVELVRGDFLEGMFLDGCAEFELWLVGERERWRQRAARLLEELVARHSQRGEREQGLHFANRLLALDPLHEPAHRHLMVLYAQAGQRGAALRQYAECERVLEEELGVSPEEETIRVYQAIKEKRELPPLAMPVSPQTGARRHNLPVQPIPFVGRETVLAEMTDRLQDPGCRLLTLVGPGGCGKTRVALEAGSAQLDHLEHGVFFVPLAPLQSVDSIVPTVAQALGHSFHGEGDPRQQLLDYLRRKRMLLILDNLEHLLEGVDLVSDILKIAPDVKILVTSRARLEVQHEHLFPVTGLEFPPLLSPDVGRGGQPSAVGRDEGEYDAIKLFLQGARRVRPAFALTGDNLADVVRICRLVDGMPLGILLASAWVGMLTPAEIGAEIAHGLDFLETDLRDVPRRQRSMRAVFDHSWSLLTERQREVLQGLSVFRGGFTRQAAQQVTGASLRELKGLVDRSLVERALTPSAPLPSLALGTGRTGGRYDVHELLRQYAAEKLELSSAVSETTGDRHCAHYTAALEQWGIDLKGARQLIALAEMDVDIENARRAWNWAAERGQVERLDRAIFGLCRYYNLRGRYQECEADCAAAAQRLEGMMSGDAPVLGKAQGLRVLTRVLKWQGRSIFSLRRYEAGQQLVQQSLALLDDPALAGQDTREERVSILEEISYMVFQIEGVPTLQWVEERLTLYQELGDRWQVAQALGALAYRAFWRGDLDEARRQLEESLALFQELGDQRGIGGRYSGLGNVALERGELDEAEHLYRKAIKILQELQDAHSIRSTRHWLGVALMRAGKFAQARRLLEETLATFGHLGDTAAAGLREVLASVEMYDGDYERARVQGETSLALSRKARYRWGIAWSLRQLSGVALAEAESGLGAGTAPQVQNTGGAREAYTEAQRLAQESVAICREMGVRVWLGHSLAILGVATRGLGDVDQARRHLCEALRVAGDMGAFWPLMLALPATALLLADGGEQERAVEIYTLVSRYPFVANSQWFEDVFGRHIAAVAAALPPEVVTAAQERGRARDLNATVAELLVELGGEQGAS
jgi:predicted ATPase/DNA-binding SARP family transcriptional activator